MSPALREPTGISPRVDCVFRALLADPAHTDRLIAFLNAVLQRASPLVAVELRNPIQPSASWHAGVNTPIRQPRQTW